MFDFISPLLERDLSTERIALLAIMVMTAVVGYPLSRLLTRGIRRRRDDVTDHASRGRRFMLNIPVVMAWPVLAAVLAIAPLLLLPGAAPNSDRLPVLTLAWFLLLHNGIDTTIRQYMQPGPHRRRLRWLVVPIIMAVAVLDQMSLLGDLFEYLNRPFLVMGGAHLSILSVLSSFGLALVFILGARMLSNLISNSILPNLGVEQALADALAAVTRSLIIVLGLLVSADAMGLDMSSLKIVLGALSVGIGFGLQNVVNNFVSGLILMFERTIKRGDIIRINETEGRVMSIGLRSSVVRTRSGHDIIVPNGELVAGHVDNLSFTDEHVRVDVPIGVSYRADPREVSDILLAVTRRTPDVVPSPPPEVLFTGYGESSIDFEVRVWVHGAWTLPRVRSALLFEAWYELKKAGVEIPFPQRDLHIRSGVVEVAQCDPGKAGD